MRYIPHTDEDIRRMLDVIGGSLGGCPRIEEPTAKPSDRSIFPTIFDK
jgi:hypothetical protein